MWYLIVITVHFSAFGTPSLIQDVPKLFTNKKACEKDLQKYRNADLSGCFFRKGGSK